MVPPLTDVLASLYDSESKLQIFLIIIDIHCPENISALVWLRSVEKPKTGSQMQVWKMSKCRTNYTRNEIGFVLIEPKILMI